jgi:uncharacterized membrane protein
MKKYLITGLIILLPVALTAMIILFLFDIFTAPFVPIVQTILSYVPFALPAGMSLFLSRILALILLCLLILALGAIARHFFFVNLMRFTNKILSHIPFVKTVYKVSRDVISALFSPDGKQGFKEAVMIPFPDKPNYCIGLSSGDAAEECQKKVGQPLVSVFMPTAPHPISGFLFLVNKKNVHPANMTKEDAVKFLVSCGVIVPEPEIKK